MILLQNIRKQIISFTLISFFCIGCNNETKTGRNDTKEQVGNIAEAQNHHPDIIFGWGYSKIKIFTHKIKGLVESDFILAAKINKIIL